VEKEDLICQFSSITSRSFYAGTLSLLHMHHACRVYVGTGVVGFQPVNLMKPRSHLGRSLIVKYLGGEGDVTVCRQGGEKCDFEVAIVSM